MTEDTKNENLSFPILPPEGIRFLGLCRRCGKVVMGAGQVLAAVTGKKVPAVVIVAADASERTKKQLRDKCSHRNIPTLSCRQNGEELAHFLGKEGVVMAVGVTDQSMGRRIISLASGEA
jgi:ribosomal protein L7Ae-like RNA K-turn-binding protein